MSLTSEPTAATTVALASQDTNRVTLSTDSLTFSTTNWNVAQLVTVQAVDNDVVEDRVQVAITSTFSGTGSDYVGQSGTRFWVNVDNDDLPPEPGVTLSAGNLTIQEGSTGSYTVVLDAQPTDTVTISVTASDSTSACHQHSGASCTRESGVATVDKSSLTFTTANWNSAQTVTVTATDEDMAGVFKFAQVAHEASGGGYDSVTVREVRVTVTDNDRRGIRYHTGSPGSLTATGSLTINEGSTDSLYVSLTSEPTAATTVALASQDTIRVTVSTDSLTFSTTNWNVAQLVTVQAVDNDVVEDRVQVAITSTFSGTGSDYAGQSGTRFWVNVDNDDLPPEPGVTVSLGGLTIHEDSSGSYTVVLDTQPTDTVTVSVTASDLTSACHAHSGASCTRKSGMATVDKSSLTFTTANWNSAQTVTVTAADEDMAGIYKYAQITHAASGGGYDSVSVRAVRVSVIDNDRRGIVYETGSPGNLRIRASFGTYEGSSHSYYVSLKTEPTAATTVTVASEDVGRVTVSPTSLTFSTTDWNVAQPVSFTVADNDVLDEDRVQVKVPSTMSGTGSDYDDYPAVWFTVNVFNNDVDPETVTEGDSLVYALGYGEYPGARTIRAESVRGAATIAPASVQVTEDNYERLPFTVTGVEAGQGKINFWIGSYLVRSFLVNVLPPAIPEALTLSANRRAREGGRDVTITATLERPAPAGGTEVTLRVGAGSTATRGDDYTLSRTEFTIADGDLTGTAILHVIDDADDEDDETVYLFANSRNPVLSSAELRLDIRDNDVPAVTLSASPAQVLEGGSVTVTAQLSSALSSSVTIPLTLTAGTAEEDDFGSLAGIEIDAGSTSGTGTISTTADADFDDETFTVALGSLPSSVRAGNPSSVEVTIGDTGPPNEPPSEPPTVTLSASPTQVLEGGPVTVTAQLSSALSSSVTIPLTLTAGTAEEDDFGSLAGIEIDEGSTSGRGTISTAADADFDDETFTVALGSLPSSVQAGSPSSVEITIWDLGPPNEPPTVAAYCDPCRVGPGGEVRLTAEAWDPEGDPLSYQWSAATGEFTGPSDQAETYWQAPADTGIVWIRVEVWDGWGGTASAEVAVEVANGAPAFREPSYAFELRENEDGRPRPVALGAVEAEDPDGDGVTYSLGSGDETRFAVGPLDGTVAYVGPGEDYETEPNRYELTVRARDPYGAAATVGVTVEVTNANEAPAAAADTAATDEDEPVTVDVLANDTDVDGDTLHIESVSQPAHGTARSPRRTGSCTRRRRTGTARTASPTRWPTATAGRRRRRSRFESSR